MWSDLKPYLKLNCHSNENGGMVFHMITTTHVCCHLMHIQLHMTHISLHNQSIKDDFISNMFVLNLGQVNFSLTFEYANDMFYLLFTTNCHKW
jgi:hypothetical protein